MCSGLQPARCLQIVGKMHSRKFQLLNAQQAHTAFKEAWTHAKGWLVAGGGTLVLEIRPAKRSDEQNRLLHACLGEIARQKEWAGSKHDIDAWKRLLTAAWLRARGESDAYMLPALDGRGVDVIYCKTSKLNKAEFSELCEFVFAWAAQNGVEIE